MLLQVKKNSSFIILILGVVSSLVVMTSCNGIFSSLYDDVETAVMPFGFKEINEEDNSGTVYIDTRDYEQWTYISLKDKTVDTVNMLSGGAEPQNWDFAVHRYDVKTNGGSALETEFRSFYELISASDYEDDDFVADTMSKVIVDMSGMMDGILLYHDSNVNKELSRWLNVDLSTMPPIYTMSKKVYVLRLDDGSRAALLFTNFMNESCVKGYITIRYIYPL